MTFLTEPAPSDDVSRLYDDDVARDGCVMNLTRLWAHEPAAMDDLTTVMSRAASEAGLSLRQRGILVTATASTLGDSYCSLTWGPAGVLDGQRRCWALCPTGRCGTPPRRRCGGA